MTNTHTYKALKNWRKWKGKSFTLIFQLETRGSNEYVYHSTDKEDLLHHCLS